MQTWLIIAGALLLPFVMLALALGFGWGVEWSRRHPKLVGAVFITLGLIYIFFAWEYRFSFFKKSALVFAVISGIAWILLGCVQFFQPRRHPAPDAARGKGSQ